MRLLVIASDPREFAGILAHAQPVAQALRLPVDWARPVKLGLHELLLAANGAGWNRAAAAVDAAAPEFRPEAVVSTGFCGALDESLEVSDLVLGTSIYAAGRQYAAAPLSCAAGARRGAVCSIDHVARTSGEKRSLRASGACAVAMEAGGVAARAENLGLPFYCVRAVTDLANENMANDFNAALRSDGHFDTIKVLQGTLRHPIARLPELLRLRSRCVRAARALGDFFADSRF